MTIKTMTILAGITAILLIIYNKIKQWTDKKTEELIKEAQA
jgi:hypothetical protein